MYKLEKGQNFNKSAEDTAVELDCEMYTDAKLIGNFSTQQVTAALAKKKNEKKIKELEKGGKDGVSGDSAKNGTRDSGHASKKNKTCTT